MVKHVIMKNGIAKRRIANIRVSGKIIKEAEYHLKKYGITVDDAVNMFLHQIAINKRPFKLRPTQETMKAIQSIHKPENEGGYSVINDIDELFQQVKAKHN